MLRWFIELDTSLGLYLPNSWGECLWGEQQFAVDLDSSATHDPIPSSLKWAHKKTKKTKQRHRVWLGLYSVLSLGFNQLVTDTGAKYAWFMHSFNVMYSNVWLIQHRLVVHFKVSLFEICFIVGINALLKMVNENPARPLFYWHNIKAL